jgi:hypothetical protein
VDQVSVMYCKHVWCDWRKCSRNELTKFGQSVLLRTSHLQTSELPIPWFSNSSNTGDYIYPHSTYLLPFRPVLFVLESLPLLALLNFLHPRLCTDWSLCTSCRRCLAFARFLPDKKVCTGRMLTRYVHCSQLC